MKLKILLIVIVILFAVSCAKNNPSNPTYAVSNTPTGNEENKSADNVNSKETSNTDEENSLDNYGEKTDLPINDNTVIDDGALEYKGKVEYTVETLDSSSFTNPEYIDIYVDIYNDEKMILIYTPNRFRFENVSITGSKYEGNMSDDNGTYTFSMTVNRDTITDFNFTILGKQERYYMKSNQLDAIK
ncbi:hypothetical protein BFL38_10220 [Brachyspira hampsonii]|uniref:DUF4352 domain-containing protein n=1 Tax=Brachyspira hampsonii TaxID=1287055 RepID=A0A1E5NI79_9SPIR|nr:hypothetical protein [Brachyspira hampsonii]OEJ15826.1 hypothetical protein BFL38_10220 [Brachyspira hampsonii]